MRRVLEQAGSHLADDEQLNALNMRFHELVAIASGNMVRRQLLHVLNQLFVAEQRLLLGIFGSRERDHQQHLLILEALGLRDESLARERMHSHLDGVRVAIERSELAMQRGP
jgi:GntR family transcriptional repressor for pyruvate dehydrogenase complex